MCSKPICLYHDAVNAARALPSQQKTMGALWTTATSSARCTAWPPGNHLKPGM